MRPGRSYLDVPLFDYGDRGKLQRNGHGSGETQASRWVTDGLFVGGTRQGVVATIDEDNAQ